MADSLRLDERRGHVGGFASGLRTDRAGLRVLDAAASKFGFDLQVDGFDFACVDYYEQHGRMMPADWNQTLQSYDAIFFGAVGWPEKVPDHVSLWGSLVQFRRQFDQYVSLRPVRLMPGVTRRWPSLARSTSSSCARTRRASTAKSAAGCSRTRLARSSARRR